MQVKRKKRIIVIVILVMVLFVGIYNVYDNNRFVIVKEDIVLDDLPAEFEGYSILQISDLHGKYFGEKQERLIQSVQSLDPDLILLTGDMNKYETSDTASTQACVEFVDGIGSDKKIIWVDGNTGPFLIESINGSCTGDVTDIGEQFEKMGVEILLQPIQLTEKGQSIWIVPELCQVEIQMLNLSVNKDDFSNLEEYEHVTNYGKLLEEWYERLNGNNEVKIRVNHFPLQANLSQEQWESQGYLDYDLSISGHYHGGQIRIPLIGALYIPCPTAGRFGGFFPSQNEVSGLNSFNDMQQYVSAGLGASASIPALDFRLFNSPEINLLTLHAK